MQDKLKQYYEKGVKLVTKWWQELKEDRNLFTFLIFLVLSTGFWFLNALQKDYTTTVEYPVEFTNIPEGFILKESKAKELQLKVKAGGFNILRYHLSTSFDPLIINVSEMTQLRDDDKAEFYLASSRFSRSINDQLSSGLSLLEVTPDTLFINLSPLKIKKVPVSANIETQFEKQYLQGGKLIINPDSVTVSGEAAIVDSIKEVYTEHTVFSNLKDTLVTNLSLVNIEGVELSDSKVSVTIPVEPFTESTVQVPIIPQNVPDSLRLKAFPPEITVSFRVSLSRFEDIKSGDFLATVQFTDELIGDNNQRLKVKLEKHPDGLYFIDYSPLFVEYLLEKR